ARAPRGGGGGVVGPGAEAWGDYGAGGPGAPGDGPTASIYAAVVGIYRVRSGFSRKGGCHASRHLRILLQLVPEQFRHIVEQEETGLEVRLVGEAHHYRLVRPHVEFQGVWRVRRLRDPATDRRGASVTVEDHFRGAQLLQNFETLGGPGAGALRVELGDRESNREPVKHFVLRQERLAGFRLQYPARVERHEPASA